MAFIPVKDIKDLGGYVVDSDEFPPPAGLTSDDILNTSTVVGATVTDALDTLSVGASGGLQSAYDNGFSILTSGDPVTVTVDEAGVGAISLIQGAAANNPLLLITKTSPGVPAVDISSTNGASELLLRFISSDGSNSQLAGDNIQFNNPNEGFVFFTTGLIPPATQSPGIIIQTGEASLGTLGGSVMIGFTVGAAPDGGILLDPTTGRIQLRRHSLTTVGLDETGTLGLIDLNITQEALLGPIAGDLHYRNDAGAGAVREQGFRAYDNGAYGLVCRGYQRTFVDADLVGAVLSVVHFLTTNAPVFMVYSNTGALVPASAANYTAVEISANQIDITFNALLLPLVGTWRVTLLGF